jgi:hypothetical protein
MMLDKAIAAGRNWITAVAEELKADKNIPAAELATNLEALRKSYRDLPLELAMKDDEVLLSLTETFTAATAKGQARTNTSIAGIASAERRTGPVTEGMYKVGERIFKVQKAVHGSGHLYAKELITDQDGSSFAYAPGIIRTLTLGDKMTIEEAKEFGALYGTCCVCARTLTNETSIEAGIGPVCAGKF